MISCYHRHLEADVAQLLVRNLEPSVKARLQRRARRHGRSMEEEARDILRNAVRQEEGQAKGLGSQIADLFRGKGLDHDIAELRGQALPPASFDR
jgi:plasmid stability protein